MVRQCLSNAQAAARTGWRRQAALLISGRNVLSVAEGRRQWVPMSTILIRDSESRRGTRMQTPDFAAERKRLLEQAAEVRLRAHSVASSAERERLIRQARACEIGARGNARVTSSDVRLQN